MQVKSFIDVLSSYPEYKGVTVVLFNLETDMFSGRPISYECEFWNSKKISVADTDKVQEFRDCITKEIEQLQNVVLIDQIGNKILSTVTNDPFFEKLAKNVGYSRAPFQLHPLTKESIAKIVEEAFPIPQQTSQECILV